MNAQQDAAADNIAFCMVGDTMAPWREDGKVVFVHPSRPPRVGNHVLVRMKSPPGEPAPCYIKKLVGRDEKRLTLAQYNPPRDNIYADLDKVERVLTVIEADELLGLPQRSEGGAS